MNTKMSTANNFSVARSWRSRLHLLVALSILCGASMARAIQTDTWTGTSGSAALSGLNAWGTAGNWSGSIAPTTAGDNFIFPASPPSGFFFSTNSFSGLKINGITFNASGYILNGNALTITNGITDNAGLISNSIPLTLGAAQTFQNNSGSLFTNTENGTINLQTNTLTVGGGAPLFFNGAISGSSTNLNSNNQLISGGSLIVLSGANARLGAANSFGTNVVVITSGITNGLSYSTNFLAWTNTYVVVGVSTNYYPFTNSVITTNGTWSFGTNAFGPQNAYAVTVQSSGILQLNNAAAIPNGANVGSVFMDGTLDLNGMSPTINGLDDSGVLSGVIDNLSAANAGLYTLTLGNANSNGVSSALIQNSFGSVGLTKTGYGTETLKNANAYSGPTIINQGTLVVAGGATLGSPSQVLTIGSGAVLDVSALGSLGYKPTAPLTVAAGTPAKPFTNYLGSYDPTFGTNYTVSISGTNNTRTYATNYDPIALTTNVVITTNFVSVTLSTNSIISIVTNDVVGNFTVNGGGAISPITSVSPGIATWSISGDLTLNEIVTPTRNRVNYLLNSTTTPGGGTNDLIAVGGTLRIGGELDFVISPVTGTLATGTYILMTSTTYTPVGTPSFVLVESRGLSGDTIQASGNNITMTSLGGTATPGSIVWAGTPALNNWDVKLSQNWKLAGVADYFYPNDNVTFNDNGNGTIVLPVVVSPGSMTFNNNRTNYTFTASAATFVTGAGGLTVNGPGTVTLQNPNSFTGDVTINGGTLALGYYNSSGTQYPIYNGVPAGNLILGGSAIININAQTASADLINFENVTVNPGASSMNMSGRASTSSPRYAISNDVIRAVGGVLNLGQATGNNAGTYFYNTNSPDGTNDYGVNGIVGGYATIYLNDWAYAPIRGVAAQYSGYQADNNPANWLANSNVLVGLSSGNPATISVPSSTTINSLRLTNGGPVTVNIASGQTLTLASGGLLNPLSAIYLDAVNGGTLMGAAGKDLVILNQNTTAASSLTIGSVIADNGGATGLTTAGGGKTILTGNNIYTGPTYILNGISGSPAGTLQIGANGTSGSIASSSAVIDNGVLAFNRSDNTSVSGVISGSGSLTKLSAGVLTLTANNTLSGLVTISAGTLQLGNGGASGAVSNAVNIVDNGTLVFDNNNTVSYPQPISGYGNLVQFGSGNLIIATNETYSGNTVVSNGTMTLTATGYLTNTASITVNGVGLFDVSALPGGTLTLRTATAETLAGSGTINGSITTAGGTTLSPGNSIGTLTINNDLALSGGNYLFDVGNASSDRINSATLHENSGTFVINVTGGALANGVYKLVHTTGGITGSASSLGLFGFNQSGQIGVLTNEASGDLSLLVYSGNIPSLAWVGSAYGGVSDIWNTSQNNWTNVLGGGALTTYANPDYALFDETISYTNAVDIQTAVSSTEVTVNATNFNYTLGAAAGSAQKLTGGASLLKTGAGVLTLLTTNDYLAGTTINGGTVLLGNNTAQAEDGKVGNGSVTLAAGSALVVSNFGTETINGAISGAGQLVQKGAGRLILAGNNSAFSGPISSTNYLQMGNGVSGTLGTGTVTNNGTLFFNVGPTPVSTVPVNANISGSGGITNLGPGIVTLNGSNTYAGRTVVSIGTLQLGSDYALPATTTLFMDDATSPGSIGTLDLNGHNAAIAGINGSTTGQGVAGAVASQIVNNGSGTVTLAIGDGGTYTMGQQLLDNNNSGSGVLALLVTNNTRLNIYCDYDNLGNPVQNLFSGGIVVSNAYIQLGNGAQGTDRLHGQHSAGLGTITLCGGLGTVTNGATGLPTNGVLIATQSGSPNSARSEYNVFPTINVPAGQSGSIFGEGYGGQTFTLTGGGTLTYQPDYVRGQLSGDWSQFTGTIIFQLITTAYGTSQGGFTITGAGNLGLPNATVYLHTNNLAGVSISGGSANNVFQIGALAGGDGTSFIGGGTQGNGSSGGAAATVWAIGTLNQTTTNGSVFTDAGCGIRKVGTGQLVLTNSIMNYGGQTVVSNGTLSFIPLGNLMFTNGGPPTVTNNVFIPLTNNYLVGSTISIVSPGILDVSGMGGTLYLGNGRNGQSLSGNGTLSGALMTMANSNTVIQPGVRVGNTNIYPGHLTISGTATINGSTFLMAIKRSSTPTYDSFTASSLTVNGASLIVTNAGDTAFAPLSTNVFQFFNTSVAVNLGGGSSGITNIFAPALPAGMFWVTNLNGALAGYPTVPAGSMAIVNTNTTVALNPYPPTVQQSVSANTLTLGWPTNLGWILQSQTNGLGVGLVPTNTWVDVAGSVTVTQKVFIIDSNQPAVFFRMRNPSAPVQ